jgi:hypothetical protein
MSTEEVTYYDAGRDDLLAEYKKALTNGGIVVQQCSSCSTTYSPPVLRCGACGSDALAFINVPMGTAKAIFNPANPRARVVVVEVEGCRVMAIADDSDITPGSSVVRVNVNEDDRAPRVGLSAG